MFLVKINYFPKMPVLTSCFINAHVIKIKIIYDTCWQITCLYKLHKYFFFLQYTIIFRFCTYLY